ncbi:sensor histidine kinase [Piscibacillus halophilus]|uniref:Two-component system, LytT family, sensor histidine kinase NatK n=2 Tax=Piscibacillus halophilus TaxID=571933 RepID=A0A1H9KSD0_9BACI|nr:GHKL domain-containing protein [Piscibacillus halophilus]SER01817.1 two-component system, LytT family, sensor histidine kinase NatK [Piscibacillus halophilus]
MLFNIFYWMVVVIFATIHLQVLLNGLYIQLPIYLTILVPVGLILLISWKVITKVDRVPVLWNGLLALVQVLLLIVNLNDQFIWGSTGLLVAFICLEWFRHILARQYSYLHTQLKNHEIEREQINNTFRIVRSERHDYLKHISALHFLIENGKTEEAKTYLNDLVEGYEETNLSIKGETGVVAATLHQAYKRARVLGISVDYSLDVPVSSLPMTDRDIVSLIGNLLSNSIDACESWQKEKGEQALLSLQFLKRSGLYILTCENNSLPIHREVLDRLYNDYGITTKEGDHEGLGTKIIHDIVQKYDGLLDFVYKDEKFLVKIKIPLIK